MMVDEMDRRNVKRRDGYQVISFQIKKRIPIGKGGMILTNDKDGMNGSR